jgi:hypothetical protein
MGIFPYVNWYSSGNFSLPFFLIIPGKLKHFSVTLDWVASVPYSAARSPDCHEISLCVFDQGKLPNTLGFVGF